MEDIMNSQVKSEDVIRVAAPLEPILSDESVWEIMIDSHEQVLVARNGQVEQVESPFSSAEELQAFIDALFGLYGIKLDADNPVGYLRLPDHSRCMAIVPPNAVKGPHVVLRRVVGPRLTWDKLIEWQSVPQQAFDILKGAVRARMNILVSGGTGSGKTTVANLIAELSPPEERLVVVEQVFEMQVEHPRVVRLEAGGPADLTVEDVLTAAARMRPDRLIVGEILGPVAASVLHYFGIGYDGSLTLIHGTSVEDALNRLESFCLMANLGLGLAEIRHLIAGGIQLITHQEHLPDGRRKIVEIAELRGIENHRYVLQPLMRYNRQTEQFDFTGAKPSWER
jgi:pilus assembly protein CpaF